MSDKSQIAQAPKTGPLTESLPGQLKTRVRSQFSPRIRVALTCGEGLTQQHFKDEVDVNKIIAKFVRTGEWPMAKKQGEYGVATAQTFTEAMMTVRSAEEEFYNLPANARKKFKNDPALYLDAAADPTQRELFVEIGLLEALPTKTVTEAPDEPPATPAETETLPPSS